MGRKAQLTAKAQEMCQLLEVWARTELRLDEREELQVTLEIVRKTVTATVSPSRVKPAKDKLLPVDREIQEDEWISILNALSGNGLETKRAREVVQELKDVSNTPIPLRGLSVSGTNYINSMIHRAGLPFSLRMLDEDRYRRVRSGTRGDRPYYVGVSDEEKRYRLVALEESSSEPA